MTNWKALNQDLNDLLQLDSHIIAVKRMEKKDGYMDIPGIENPQGAFTYCQLPYLVRKEGRTIGITKADATPLAEKMQLRCGRFLARRMASGPLKYGHAERLFL